MLTLEEAQSSPCATITVKDAAQLAGVDPRTLTSALSVHGGTIPSLRIGRRIVLPRRPFLNWLTMEPHHNPHDDTAGGEPFVQDAAGIVRAKLIELLGALESVG